MADPRWSEQVVTPASFGTKEARQAARPDGNVPAWVDQMPTQTSDTINGSTGGGDINWPTLTGQNLEGPTNAFDTTFWEKANKQNDEQRERGLRDRWTRPDATGVVVYNDPSQDLKFGDVFVNGKKQGNMREGYAGLDAQTSQDLLARLTLNREVWAKAYEAEAGRPMSAAGTVAEEIAKVEKANTEAYAKGLTAEDFEQGVTERAEGYLNSTGDQVKNVLAGIGGGAVTGFGAGSIIPGVGTLVSTVVGGVAGGVGAWLNRDETMTALAQANEQWDMATREGHTAVGVGDALSGYAGYAGGLLNPTRNLFHGGYDYFGGDIGDAKSTYYNSEHGLAIDALDTAALLVDGIGSFGSSLGRKAFTATMGAGVGGELTSIGAGALQDNITFNPYTGTYEELSNVGMALRVAGAGIDVAQTGAARGAGRIIDRARGGVTADSAGGFKIVTTQAGERATGRLGLSALIPSEAATGLSARMLARRTLRKEGREATRENMATATARHIDNLTTGRATIGTAMVNGFGEGAEEFVQAGLEAAAFGEVPTFRELFNAARQGFGMGVGMGTALGRSAKTTTEAFYERSSVLREMRGQEIIPPERWKQMTMTEMAAEGTISDAREKAIYDTAVKELHRSGAKFAAANIPELRRAVDVARERVLAQAANAEGAVEPSRLQVHSSHEWGPQDYVVSLGAALSDVRARVDLLNQTAAGTIRGKAGQLLAVTPEQREQAARIAETDTRLLRTMEQVAARIDQTADSDVAGREALINELNGLLQEMWAADRERPESYGMRRSAGVWGARFPLNAAGSFQLLRLQISPRLTEQGANSTVLIPDDILAPTGGDYDGDRFVNLLRDLIPDEQYDELRWGAGQLTSTGTMLGAKTYTVAYVEKLFDAMAKPGSIEHKAASAMLTRVRSSLMDILVPAMPRDVARKQVRKFTSDLSNRRPEAIRELLDRLATTYSPAMRALAQEMDGSPYLAIQRLVDNELRTFATQAALRAPERPERQVQLPEVSAATPRWKSTRLSQPSQMADAMFQLDKHDAFRTQTVLKYNARREATETAPQELEGAISELTRIFTMLNDGLVAPGEEAMFSGTVAQERAQEWIRNIALSERDLIGARTTGEAMVLLAGAQVADVDVDARAPRSDGEVTFVQSVLHQVLNGLRRSYSQVINTDAAVASRISSLDALTVPNRTDARGGRHAAGGSAFVEVFGAMPLYELLGDQGAAINTYTVRTLRDTLVSMRADTRRDFERALKAHPSYVEEREAPEGVNPFSPYRVLVDNVMESAHQLMHEVDGLARGELARGSEQASVNFASMHDKIRSLANAAGMKLTDPATVRKFLASRDTGLAERVLAIMEADGLRAGLVARDPNTGAVTDVKFPQWIYEVLAEPSTARAEMALLRHTLKYGFAALADTDGRLDASKVNDRILRLWLHLDYAANDMDNVDLVGAGAALLRFTEALNDPTMTIDAFMRLLNTDPRMRMENEAPYMPWARDRSVVEASRYGKGVSEVMNGTEMRDALRDAEAAAANELRSTNEVRSFLEKNATLLSDLREARDPKSMNHQLWQRFEKWVETARELPTLIGATVWVQQAKHINEILGHMGVKGMSPDNVVPLGRAIAAQLPTFDAAVGQLVASATSASMGSVLTDMALLARGDRQVVMEDGTVVDWTALTAEDALELLSNDDTVGLAARALGMTAWDYNEDLGTNSLTSVIGKGLAGFVADPGSSLFSNATSARMRRLMVLEGMATRPGGTPIVPVLLAQQMNIREAAVEHVIDSDSPEREAMAIEILEDMADALQKGSTLEGLYVPGTDRLTLVEDDAPDGGSPQAGGFRTPNGTGQPVTLINRGLLRAGRTVRRAHGNGNLVSQLVPAKGPLRDIGIGMLQRWQAKFAANAVASGNEALIEIAKRTKKDLDRIDDYTGPLDILLDEYADYNSPVVRERLLRHLRALGDIDRAAVWAAPEIRRALNPNTPVVSTLGHPDLPDLTSKQWEMVARAVIAHTMHTTYGLAASSDMEISVFPSLKDPDTLDGQRGFWDPTFVEPAMDIFAPGLMSNHEAALSPLFVAQLELTRKMGGQLPSTTSEEFEAAVRKFIMPKRTNAETGAKSGVTGPWHAHLPALMHSAVGAVVASAAEMAISMAGINPHRLRMLIATTRRNWSQRPDDAALSVATLPASALITAVDEGTELDSRIDIQLAEAAAPVERPLAQLEGRIVRSVTLTMPDGTERSLLGDPRYATGMLLPASTGVAPGEGGVISLKTMGEAIGTLLLEADVPRDQWDNVQLSISLYHPDSKGLFNDSAYSHNPWFDGVNGRTDAAFSQPSLLGSFFFGTDGTIPAAYETALSAIKKLTFALQQVTTMPETTRRAIVDGGTSDMSSTLHQLTTFILKQRIDGKAMGPDRYNAIYKLLSLMYVTRYIDESGQPVVLSAEQTIARQLRGETFSELSQAQVIGLPLEHVLGLMGEGDLQSLVVDVSHERAFSTDVDRAQVYNDFPADAWTKLFPGLVAVDRTDDGAISWRTRNLLDHPRLRNVTLPSHRTLAPAGRARGEAKDFYRTFRDHQRSVQDARSMRPDVNTRWAAQNAGVTKRMLVNTNITQNALQATHAAGNGDFVGSARMRSGEQVNVEPTFDVSTAFEYVHKGARSGSAIEGVLTFSDLGSGGADDAALGDKVFIRASTFLQGEADVTTDQMFPEARQVLDKLMGVGATIGLPRDPVASELRSRMVNHLRERGYMASEENGDLFEPRPTAARSRAEAAFASSLRATQHRTSRNRALVVLSNDVEITENSIASVNDGLGALEDYFVREAVQTARYAGYVPPVDPESKTVLAARLLPLLRKAAGQDYLRAQSGLGQADDGTETGAATKLEAETDFKRALEALIRRLESVAADPGASLMPEPGEEFGTGDIIPLISYDRDGSISGVHLYRHGHAPVSEEAIAGSWPEGNEALSTSFRLTIDKAKIDAEHTTHRGELVERRWLGLNGFVARVRVRMDDLGSKVFETLTGMKWTTTPRGDLVVPKHKIFAGRPVLGVADMASPASKTSDGWWLNTPSHIIESVGFDTMPHLVRALTGVEYTDQTRDAYATAVTQVRDILQAFRSQTVGSLDPVAIITRNTSALQLTVMDMVQTALFEATDGELVVEFDDQAAGQRGADLTYLRLVLTSLAAGAQLDEVLQAPGYLAGQSASHTMHPVFTTLLHQLPRTHPARLAFVEQVNARMPVGENGIDRFELLPDLTWLQFVQREDGMVLESPAMLAFPEIRNTSHNDALSEQAAGRKQRGGRSATTNAMLFTAWGATSLSDTVATSTAVVFGPNEFLHTGEEGARKMAFRSGLGVDARVQKPTDYLPMSQAEREHIYTRALPAAAALKVAIDDSRWYEGQSKQIKETNRRKYREAFDTARRLLGLNASQSSMVEELIRSVVARPAPVDDRASEDFLTYREAMAALRLITDNARKHTLPTHRGAVPMSREVLLAMKRGGFILHRSPDSKVPVESWEGWVDVLLSSAFSSDPELRGYIAVSNMIDGVMYAYRDDVNGMPTTLSSERRAILDIVQVESGTLIASHVLRRRISSPSVQDGEAVSLSELRASETEVELLPQDARAIVEKRMDAWERRNGLVQRRRQSPRAEAIRGAQVREELARTGMLMQVAQIGYVAKSLLNPGLYVSSFLELGQRKGQEKLVSFLAGENLGAQQFTPAQRQQWKDTIAALAKNDKFYSMVYGNTNFQQQHTTSTVVHKAQRWLTAASATVNDPTWGRSADGIAATFLEAAWDSVRKYQPDRYISLEDFLDAAATNPELLENISPDAVQRGYRRVEYQRNLQDNLMERLRRRIVEGAISRGGPAGSTLGVVLLRFPTMFFRFRSNTIINLLGLQGPHAALTTLLSDRTKRAGGFKDHLDGGVEISDQAMIEDATDLTRAILRSGVSHTQLFVLGSILGSFSGGDDEEDKLLNKLRRYQHTPVSNDPLKLENDWRHAQAWFSGLFPGGAAVPTWVTKIFVSPAMGVARFADTGDFRQVYWGFMDALGSMPLLNIDNVMNSWHLANELSEAAGAASLEDNIEGHSRAQRLLTQSLATLEGMLFESAFASLLYQAGDEWDRDPYKRPMLASDGSIATEGMDGTPRPTEILEDYIDPDTGEPKQGYVGRRGIDAQLHALGENRPIFAIVAGMIMQDSTLWRYNQPVKQRELNAEELTEEEAEKIVVSIYNNETGQEELTLDGAEGIVRGIHLGALKADSPALQNVFIPQEMREKLQVKFLEEITTKYINSGYSKKEALYAAKEEYYGQAFGEEEGFGLADIINGDQIPRFQTQKYMQLNTTYVMGPNNRPVATGVQRGVLAAFGAPFDFFHTGKEGGSGNLEVDQLLNSVDSVRGANLGMRALVKMDETWNTPTDVEIGESIEKALDELGDRIEDAVKDQPGYTPWKNYRRRSYGRGGGGYSSKGYYQGPGFIGNWGGDDVKVFAPRRIEAPRADDLYSINTSNPIIRRATLRRERFSSERGRLNQWQ